MNESRQLIKDSYNFKPCAFGNPLIEISVTALRSVALHGAALSRS
jgi:hypothetical protein